MEPSKEILIIIRKIIRSLNLESKRIDKEYGITIPQMFCLNHLYSCDHYQSTHKELRQILSLNSSTVTGIVDRLEKKGLVIRLPNKQDKRVTKVGLTTKGMSLMENTPPLMQDKLSAGLKELSKNEVDNLTSSLKKISDFLGLENIEASPILTTDEPLHEGSTPMGKSRRKKSEGRENVRAEPKNKKQNASD